MSMADETADLLPGAPLSRAVLLVRRLIWLYAIYAAIFVLMLGLDALPIRAAVKMKGMAVELVAGGLGETALLGTLLSLLTLAGAGLLTTARLTARRSEAAMQAGELESGPPSLFAVLWRLGPGRLAREGQAAVFILGAVAMALLARFLWPSLNPPAVVSANANLVAAVVIGMAFPSLIAERMMSAFPATQMPEAPGLRRILLLTTLILAAAGVAEVGRSVGFVWVAWAQPAFSSAVRVMCRSSCSTVVSRFFNCQVQSCQSLSGTCCQRP